MEITFADGTRIEVPVAGLEDFVRYDLKWVEFVHGRASEKLGALRANRPERTIISPTVKRCASPSLRGC